MKRISIKIIPDSTKVLHSKAPKIRLLLQPKLRTRRSKLSNTATAVIQARGIFSPFPLSKSSNSPLYLAHQPQKTQNMKPTSSAAISQPPSLKQVPASSACPSSSPKNTHTAATHYIKPLASSSSEISYYRLQSQDERGAASLTYQEGNPGDAG
jgi:hypothetical protein